MIALLTDAQLAMMRQTVKRSMSLACTVQGATKTPDGSGSKAETWNTIETTVAGMKQPSASILQNYADKIESLASFQVRMPDTTLAREGHRLIINEHTLKVQAVLTPQGYSVEANLLCVEVKPS